MMEVGEVEKYKVEVGGFVSVYRQRVIIVHAKTEEEAKEKACSKFVDLQHSGSGSPMCDEGTVNSIEQIEKPHVAAQG
jgi:hypothetical protein